MFKMRGNMDIIRRERVFVLDRSEKKNATPIKKWHLKIKRFKMLLYSTTNKEENMRSQPIKFRNFETEPINYFINLNTITYNLT